MNFHPFRSTGLSFSDKRFLEKLYKREYKRMYYTAVKILSSRESAEDVVQTVFEKLIKKVSLLRGFENERAISKYILISTRNTSLNLLRHQHQTICLEEIEPYLSEQGKGVEQEVILHFDIEAVEKAIAEMNPVFGDAFYLHHFLGLEYSEIADAMSIPVNTARTRVFRACEQEKIKKDIIDSIISF